MNNAIAAAEAARPHTGRTGQRVAHPPPATIDLGGTLARTLAYGDNLPGPVIRANVGDELEVTGDNHLNDETSVHWHGIGLRSDMDGAPPATPDIAAGADLTYRFPVPYPGTYWAHPHTGLDDQRPAVLRYAAANDSPRSAGHVDVRQPDDDVALDAPARQHLSDDPPRRQPRPPQGHRHRAAMQTVTVSLLDDNPGSVWMLHCHNIYHQEAGMKTTLNYTT